MGGSLSGGLWGLVLGGVGLSVTSLVMEQPAGNAPPLAPQLTAPAAQTEPAPTDLTPDTPDVAREFAVDAPRVAAPAAEVTPPETDATPSTPPETPDVAIALALPESVSNPEISAGMEEPLLSRTLTRPAPAPLAEQDVVITTQPVQAAPEVPAADTNQVAGVAEDTAIVPLPEVVPDPVSVTPPAPERELPLVVDAPVAQETAQVEEPVTQPPVVELPIVEPPVAETDDVVLEAEEPADTNLVPEIAQVVPEPVIVAPADTEETSLPQLNAAVRVNRPGAAPTETAGQEAEVIGADVIPDDAPALERYAAEFDRTDTSPLIAILIVDDEQATDVVQQVAALSFPVTVVIDALQPDANNRMRLYRDAGVEVALKTSLPAGAIPTDVEVAFAAAFDILPESVALFSDGTGIFQNNRAVTSQVIDVLKSEGRGLVAVESGFGGAVRAAEQAELPAAAILRDLDGAGETGAAIARALDQAAFRARQSGDAVLLARASDQTLDALQQWGAENNGVQITLAPVSAVLGDGDQ